MSFYDEIKYYLVEGVYHPKTTDSDEPKAKKNRKAVIRKAAKSYVVQGKFHNVLAMLA